MGVIELMKQVIAARVNPGKVVASFRQIERPFQSWSQSTGNSPGNFKPRTDNGTAS
jgi:hypothetical protein